MPTNVRVINEVDVDVNHLPTVDVDVIDLPTVDVDVNSLPDLKITEVGPVGPVTLAGIPDRYTVDIASLPDLNLRIKEIPSIRAHIPANFRLGFSLLGVELAALNLCGEAQVITEPYVPNPCERCGAPRSSNLQQVNDIAAVLRVTDRG
jgi:hypothetical protein